LAQILQIFLGTRWDYKKGYKTMSTQNIALFKALGAKMDYLTMRQRVVSQNIANADTPGYKPKDLKPVDFGKVLNDVADTGSVSLISTNAGHMMAPGQTASGEARKAKTVYEVAPAGNAVIMEEQIINSNQTSMDYNLMTSLYQKNVRMIKIALGTQ
jgi:flagellar basal-body rod protein FlgB